MIPGRDPCYFILIIPIFGVVALGTLWHWRGMVVVIGRSMATLAVGLSIMAKIGIIPIVSVMAVGTLPGIMAAGRGVATLAVSEARMVEVDLTPIGGAGMAVGTLAGKMSGRSIATMAGLAVGKAGMVKGGITPIGGVVAGGALT